MQYAGFYILNSTAAKPKSVVSSRRLSKDSDLSETSTLSPTSEVSAASPSSSSKMKRFFKKVVEELRPTTEPITSAGIYAPIIQRGPLFRHGAATETNKA